MEAISSKIVSHIPFGLVYIDCRFKYHNYITRSLLTCSFFFFFSNYSLFKRALFFEEVNY